MAKTGVNLQDNFLNQIRREGGVVSVTLTDGSVLEGVVTAFDSFTLALRTEDRRRLVYKHAIACVSASRADVPPGAARAEKDASNAVPKGGRGEADRPSRFNPVDLSGVRMDEAAPPEKR